jgi:hypothetical protein
VEMRSSKYFGDCEQKDLLLFTDEPAKLGKA